MRCVLLLAKVTLIGVYANAQAPNISADRSEIEVENSESSFTDQQNTAFLKQRLESLSIELASERESIVALETAVLTNPTLSSAEIQEASQNFSSASNAYLIRRLELLDADSPDGRERSRILFNDTLRSLDRTQAEVDQIGLMVSSDNVGLGEVINQAKGVLLNDTAIVALTKNQDDLLSGVYSKSRLFDHFDPYLTRPGEDGYTSDNPEVGMLAKRDENSGRWLPQCTGTLVEKNVVVTAAHCVCPIPEQNKGRDCNKFHLDNPNKVDAYEYFLSGVGAFSVSSVYVDPEYELGVFSDVALLKLSLPVVEVAPAETILTSSDFDPTASFAVVGYGYSSESAPTFSAFGTIRAVGLKVKGSFLASDCVAPQNMPDHELDIKERFLCWVQDTTVGGDSAIGACHGDSGGPVYTSEDGNDLLAITSFGKSCKGDINFTSRLSATQERISAKIAEWVTSDDGVMIVKSLKQLRRVRSSENEVWSYPIFVTANAGDLVVTANGSLEHDYDMTLVERSSGDVFCENPNTNPYSVCRVSNPTPGEWQVRVIATEQVQRQGVEPLFQLSAMQYKTVPDNIVVSARTGQAAAIAASN